MVSTMVEMVGVGVMRMLDSRIVNRSSGSSSLTILAACINLSRGSEAGTC